MAAVRRPAMGDRIGRLAALHGQRPVPAPVGAEELLPLGIEPGERFRAREVGKVITPFPVLRLVVYDAAVDLHLACRVVALEVRRVILRIPETELDRGEHRQVGRFAALVADAQPPDLERLAQRYEVQGLGPHPEPRRRDLRIGQAVPALITVQVTLGRLPGRRPVLTRAVVTQVEITATGISRDAVVAVSGDPPHPGISIARVPARRIRDDAEIGIRAQVIDPRHGGVWPGDHIFAVIVVEVAVAHRFPSVVRSPRAT